jgi:hypothetical protein
MWKIQKYKYKSSTRFKEILHFLNSHYLVSKIISHIECKYCIFYHLKIIMKDRKYIYRNYEFL